VGPGANADDADKQTHAVLAVLGASNAPGHDVTSSATLPEGCPAMTILAGTFLK
jgi:hypothetical protein